MFFGIHGTSHCSCMLWVISESQAGCFCSTSWIGAILFVVQHSSWFSTRPNSLQPGFYLISWNDTLSYTICLLMMQSCTIQLLAPAPILFFATCKTVLVMWISGPSTISFNWTKIRLKNWPKSSSAHSPGVMFDNVLTMKQQVDRICQTTGFAIWRIRSIFQFFTTQATKTLCHVSWTLLVSLL